MKAKAFLLILLAAILVFSGCMLFEPIQPEAPAAAEPDEAIVPAPLLAEGETITATIDVEKHGTIIVELYPNIAPQSVCNFVYLARQGFYDGLTFHRIIEGFMIQGGDPEGTGMGGPGYTIKGEFAANGIVNDLKHEPGVISMARGQGFDSAGSQFFIVHEDADHLNGQYAAFGKVIEGMDVVDSIAKVNVQKDGQTPRLPVVITSITIDGPELPEPEKLG